VCAASGAIGTVVKAVEPRVRTGSGGKTPGTCSAATSARPIATQGEPPLLLARRRHPIQLLWLNYKTAWGIPVRGAELNAELDRQADIPTQPGGRVGRGSALPARPYALDDDGVRRIES
jgi:hypothetical protein